MQGGVGDTVGRLHVHILFDHLDFRFGGAGDREAGGHGQGCEAPARDVIGLFDTVPVDDVGHGRSLLISGPALVIRPPGDGVTCVSCATG